MGLVFCGFGHLVQNGHVSTLGWVVFALSICLGAWFWYRVGTGPSYKPNWGFPKTGKISLGGIVHLPYFGFGVATTAICLFHILKGDMNGQVLFLTIAGWSIYIAAVVEDTLLGYKDALETSAPPLVELVKTGRIRGTLFTFLFTLGGFVMYEEIQVDWGIALLAALSCSLLHMSIMTFNDWYDRSHDLQKGKRLAFDYPKAFWGYWVKLTVVTLVLIGALMFYDLYLGVLCLAVLLTGLIYSYLENIIVLNNLIVAVCGASPVLCGSVYLRTSDHRVWIWYRVFFLIVLWREIVKDIDDVKVDRGYKHTLAVALGVENAKRISLVTASVSGFFLYLTRKADEVLVVLALLVYKFVKWDPTSNPKKIILLIDTVMGLALICMVVPQKYGAREVAMLDLWSIEHFLLGVVMYPLLRKVFPNSNIKKLLLVIFAIAYSWELAEFLMESGVFGIAISDWKRGFEHWSNRLIADPLLVLLGGFISTKKQNLWKWLLVPWAVWGLANYLASNSMFIQEYILRIFQ
ncbi:MAG: UbiA family prenyltransferase [Candidatus Magasanikbacteria bacterium]|nr:UbiA family prenyltransferase [Candidatus Magasanikbacteria bacterium]